MDNFYQKILNRVPFGYSYQKLIYDEKGNLIDYLFLEVNPAFLKMFGYRSKDIVGTKASELNLDKALFSSEFLKKISKLILEDDSFEFEISSNDKKPDLKVSVEIFEKDFFIMNFQDNSELVELKLRQDRLKLSVERFKSLFENAPLGYQSLDENGNFLEVNEQWLKLLGYTRDEVIGKWFGSFMPQKYQKKIKKLFPFLKKRGHVNAEFELMHKNGEILFVAFNGRIVNNEKGEFKQTHCLLKDITKEKVLKNKLEVNRQLIRSIIDNTSDSIYVKDTSGKYLLFNKAAEKIDGITAEEVLGKDDFVIFKPEEARLVRSDDRKVMTSKKTIEIIERLTYNSDDIHDISSTKGPIFNKDNELIGIFGISRDITERIKLEEKLEKSLNEQQLLIDNLQAGVIIYNGDYSVLSCNKVVEKLLGLSKEEIISNKGTEPYWKFFRENGSLLCIDEYPVKRIIKSKSKLEPYILSVLSTGNNVKKWILINGYPILDGNNEIEKIVISFIDITDSKKIEEKLAKQNILYRQMEKAAKIGAFKFNIKTQIQNWSDEVFNILDVDIKMGEPLVPEGIDYISPEYRGMAIQAIDNAINLKEPYFQEWEVTTLKGNKKWVQSIGNPIIKDGIVTDISGSVQDITVRKESEIALKKSEERYRLITDNAVDVITVFNISENMFVYVSPSIEKLLGYSVPEFMDKKLEDIFTDEFRDIVDTVIPNHIEGFYKNQNLENNHRIEVKQICKNGDIIWVEIVTSYQYNTIGEIEAVCVSRNIEERKTSEGEMLRLSYHDQLTGLYNRRFYEEELSRLDTPRNLPIALIMADVNGLKLTNDAFGHQKGDELLIRIANILKEVTRDDEIISRIGGDEFVVLMPRTDALGAEKLIKRIKEAVNKEQIDDIVVSLALGYAAKSSSSEEMDKVFKEAEDEMYRHKLTESSSMRSKTIDIIMNSLFKKNIRERDHSKRVAEICEFLASKMNFTNEEIKQIRIAGLMHDIGKIVINNAILEKKDSLTNEEWDEMKKHSEVGYRILGSVNKFSEIAEYVLAHQERYDGEGYPQGLKGDNIPLQSRIIAVAAAFDAMISDRSYKPKMTEEEALLEIKKNAGTQFDPEIAKLFIKNYMNKNS